MSTKTEIPAEILSPYLDLNNPAYNGVTEDVLSIVSARYTNKLTEERGKLEEQRNIIKKAYKESWETLIKNYEARVEAAIDSKGKTAVEALKALGFKKAMRMPVKIHTELDYFKKAIAIHWSVVDGESPIMNYCESGYYAKKTTFIPALVTNAALTSKGPGAAIISYSESFEPTKEELAHHKQVLNLHKQVENLDKKIYEINNKIYEINNNLSKGAQLKENVRAALAEQRIMATAQGCALLEKVTSSPLLLPFKGVKQLTQPQPKQKAKK